MVMVGRHDERIGNAGSTSEVNTFTPYFDMLQEIPIFDTELLYVFQ